MQLVFRSSTTILGPNRIFQRYSVVPYVWKAQTRVSTKQS